jgi:hypothetical protein
MMSDRATQGEGMRGRLKTRITLDAALTLVSLALCFLTLFNRDWIEGLTGLDPDAGSGAVEGLIAICFGLAAVGFGALAVREADPIRSRRVRQR